MFYEKSRNNVYTIHVIGQVEKVGYSVSHLKFSLHTT